MSVTRSRIARGLRRWTGWDEKPLEARLLMSTVPLAAQIQAARAHAGVVGGYPGRLTVSLETSLTIENRTGVAVRIGISNIDNYDWDGVDRPDHNLNGVVLRRGSPSPAARKSTPTPNRTSPSPSPSARTGASIVTARALLDANYDRMKPYPYWTLVPWKQNIAYEGKSLTFHSVPESMVTPRTGTFILTNTTQSPRGTFTRVNSSQATDLTVENRSNVAVRLGVSDIDNYDWDGVDRPDHNLNGVVLAPGQSVTRREEINARANPSFTLSLTNANTGAWIGSARASCYEHQDIGLGYFTWTVSPNPQVFQDGSRSLVFSSQRPSARLRLKGVFTLSDATPGRGRAFGRLA